MYRAQERIQAEFGRARPESGAELNVSRHELRFGTVCFGLSAVRGLIAIVVAKVSTIIGVHLQNGFILPLHPPRRTLQLIEDGIHNDFTPYLYDDPASTRTCFAIGSFARENGTEVVVSGSLQRPMRVSTEQMVRAQPPCVQQLLGGSTRVATDRGEYSLPALRRPHRKEHE